MRHVAAGAELQSDRVREAGLPAVSGVIDIQAATWQAPRAAISSGSSQTRRSAPTSVAAAWIQGASAKG